MATLCILLGRSFTRNWSEILQESQDICLEAHFGKAWQMILQGFFFSNRNCEQCFSQML